MKPTQEVAAALRSAQARLNRLERAVAELHDRRKKRPACAAIVASLKGPKPPVDTEPAWDFDDPSGQR